ncbi:hypothetical protein ACFL4W_04605 [Planctomycetota bacterium]
MAQHRCPGQNVQFWGPKDIFAVACPECGQAIEFFKDDAKRPCPECGKLLFNPRVNTGCALWCPKAEDCLGPEQYESIMETKNLAEKRKADMELLLSLIPDQDADIRMLFKKLYIENANPARLIDTDRLRDLQETDPGLFKRAIEYFSRFNQDRD